MSNGQWVVTKSGNPGGFVTTEHFRRRHSLVEGYVPAKWRHCPDYAGDWSGVNLFNKAGDKVWPICAFTYMHIRQSYT